MHTPQASILQYTHPIYIDKSIFHTFSHTLSSLEIAENLPINFESLVRQSLARCLSNFRSIKPCLESFYYDLIGIHVRFNTYRKRTLNCEAFGTRNVLKLMLMLALSSFGTTLEKGVACFVT